MSKPNNSVSKIKLPGESTGRPIIPYAVAYPDGTHQATLPSGTISADKTLATTDLISSVVVEVVLAYSGQFTHQATLGNAGGYTVGVLYIKFDEAPTTAQTDYDYALYGGQGPHMVASSAPNTSLSSPIGFTDKAVIYMWCFYNGASNRSYFPQVTYNNQTTIVNPNTYTYTNPLVIELSADNTTIALNTYTGSGGGAD